MLRMTTFGSREEWLEGRKYRIGGSEAGAVVGLNPYMTNAELWEIKTGRTERADISEKPAVKYGHDAEPLIRQLFALDHPELKVEYVENNMFFNDDFPFAHASLDGWLTDADGRKGILEIKTTTIQSTGQWEKWKGRIPDSYFIQVLHYLLVTGWDFAILTACIKSKDFESETDMKTTIKTYRIDRAEVEADIKVLQDAEAEFYTCIKTDKRPNLILPNI